MRVSVLGCRVSGFNNEAQFRDAHRRSPLFCLRVYNLVLGCWVEEQPPGGEILFGRVSNVLLARSLALSFCISLYLSLYLSTYLTLALARSRCLSGCRAICLLSLSLSFSSSLSLSPSLAPYGNMVKVLLLLVSTLPHGGL